MKLTMTMALNLIPVMKVSEGESGAREPNQGPLVLTHHTCQHQADLHNPYITQSSCASQHIVLQKR